MIALLSAVGFRRADPKPGTLLGLIEAYRGAPMAERGRPIAEFVTPAVVALRDATAREHKRWMANHSVMH